MVAVPGFDPGPVASKAFLVVTLVEIQPLPGVNQKGRFVQVQPFGRMAGKPGVRTAVVDAVAAAVVVAVSGVVAAVVAAAVVVAAVIAVSAVALAAVSAAVAAAEAAPVCYCSSCSEDH